MRISAQFLEPEDMQIELTAVMSLREASILASEMQTIPYHHTVHSFISGLQDTIRKVRQEFVAEQPCTEQTK